ncbi:caspase family protein [Dactylosporangium sp. NBC_01737]|uniref:caspase family protein n=1 Tax=Dactylosporangium sp. NBC_01737 TaxID=2975959 RepID=UPI002E151EE1|nr:caspase family protein [Dactylosporangium sp. NBC_01737]
MVVGVDRYDDPRIKELSCARADAEAVAGLIERIHPDERRVTMFLNEEATAKNVKVAIGETLPRTVEEGDVVLVYFAGHGTPETGGGPDDVSRYLIMHDTDYDNIYATGIDMERDLARWFERLKLPRLVLLIADACFSGRAGGRTFEGPALRRSRAGTRAAEPISLKALDLGEGRLMLSACTDTQVAREDRTLGHGIFTHYLLRGPSAAEGSATVGVHTLYEQLARSVRDHTSGRQTPVINGRSTFAQLPYLW